jgi:hypothetical protein
VLAAVLAAANVHCQWRDQWCLPALLLLVVILIEWFVFFWDRPRRDSLTQSSQN